VHGCRRALACACLTLVAAIGCQPITFNEAEGRPEPAAKTAAEFDPAACGSVAGEVTWQGELPRAETIRAWLSPEAGVQVTVPNPLVPDVDHGAVRGAVVFLRGVDARKARPWSHPNVTVVQEDYQIRIAQGDEMSQVGFVQRGGAIEMTSRQAVFHSLHLSGATYATIPFADADVVRRRVLDHAGLVELSSAAGYYWARGFVFVDDHPYYTRTDNSGHFVLDDVPEGEYEVVCWLPGWRETSHTRDPESALITRRQYEPALETVQRVCVERKARSEVRFAVSGAQGER
jgi:hypothetical protein